MNSFSKCYEPNLSAAVVKLSPKPRNKCIQANSASLVIAAFIDAIFIALDFMKRIILQSASILALLLSQAIATDFNFDRAYDALGGAALECHNGSQEACDKRDPLFSEIERHGLCLVDDGYPGQAHFFFLKGQVGQDGFCSKKTAAPVKPASGDYISADEYWMDRVCASEKVDPIPNAAGYYRWLEESWCEN